jgi:hypothetical protein
VWVQIEGLLTVVKGSNRNMIDKSELEEMVAQSPHGTTFIVPTLAGDGFFWSFLVHDSLEVIESITATADPAGCVDDCVDIRCDLIPSNTRRSRAVIVAFLFKFETDPPEVYSAFMNPMDEYVKEALQDLTHQDKLVFEFFDSERVASMSCRNRFKEDMGGVLELLAEIKPFKEDAFDIAVDDLLSRRPDPSLIWEYLDTN